MYNRKKTSNPDGSIKSQEQRLRAHKDLKNVDGLFGEVTQVYVNRAKSGKVTKRSEPQRLLIAIAAKEVTFVMVSEISRSSRSFKYLCQIWELMQGHGCQFQSLREQFDKSTAAGEMVLFTVANIAQFERRQIPVRVKVNLLARAKRGLSNGGSIPLGYRLAWAELLSKTVGVDPEIWSCGARMVVDDAITNDVKIAETLARIGITSTGPPTRRQSTGELDDAYDV